MLETDHMRLKYNIYIRIYIYIYMSIYILLLYELYIYECVIKYACTAGGSGVAALGSAGGARRSDA